MKGEIPLVNPEPEKEPFDLEEAKKIVIKFFKYEIHFLENGMRKNFFIMLETEKDFGAAGLIERDKKVILFVKKIEQKEELLSVLKFLKSYPREILKKIELLKSAKQLNESQREILIKECRDFLDTTIETINSLEDL